MWDTGLMESDLHYMWRHMSFFDWSWVKWTFLLLGLLHAAGVRIRYRSIALHVTAMFAVMAGLIALFLYGVATRGLFGSVPRSTHSVVFYVPLVIHVVAGAIYLVLGMIAISRGPSAVRDRVLLQRHASCGRWASGMLYLSVAFALPL